ncbi:hypothetical protein [Microbulbifer discodermiae]|uniref:hypothetical protein n=1 Tax=Microbulbifer sp. 2201CG32-9 TaxID=3232309 RepID=UPI00345C4DA9
MLKHLAIQEQVITDDQLSLEALGLLVCLLNDRSENIDALGARRGHSQENIDRILEELASAGYMQRLDGKDWKITSKVGKILKLGGHAVPAGVKASVRI